MDQDDKKKETGVKKWIATGLLLLVIVGIAAVTFAYHRIVEPRGYTWLFPWIEPAMLMLLLLAGIWIALLWVPVQARRKGFIFDVSLILYGLFVVGSAYLLPQKVSVHLSPEHKHALVVEEDSRQKSYSVQRIYYRILTKQKEILPFEYPSKIKYQWLEEDVCAVTGVGEDGKKRQYLATFGDRGDGISYADPLASMQGHWIEEGPENERFEVTVDTVIKVKRGELSWCFETSDCERFGTIAVTLDKGEDAVFALVMNRDCRLNDYQIAKGGTLTLCPVSLNETEPVILTSTDEREEYAEPEWMRAGVEVPEAPEIPKTAKEIVELMRSLAKEYPAGAEGYRAGISDLFFVPTKDADMNWNVRNVLKELIAGNRGWDNIDVTEQIETIQCLAGDETDGFYKVTVSGLYISPGYTGIATGDESQSMLYLRLVRAEEGYYVYRSYAGEEMAWDLEKNDSAPQDVSKRSEYHYFIPGHYDPTDMYEYAKLPEEGMEEIYEEELREIYPMAVVTEYEGIPAMWLDAGENLFLLYDGISADFEHYCYRKVKADRSELTSDTRCETLEEYQTVMKRKTDFRPDFTAYGGTWTSDGKPADEVRKKGGAVLECTIRENRWFEGSLQVQDASGQQAWIDNIQSGIADTRIFEYRFGNDGHGNSGTLHISFERGKIVIKLLNVQKNTGNGSEFFWDSSYELLRQEEKTEEYHFMDTYDGSFEKEMQVPGTDIRYRMIVEDAALGSRFYGLIKSVDDGETWDIVSDDPFNSQMGMGIDFTFLDEDFGFATLAHNGGDSAVLYVTENGGKSYEQVEIMHWTVTSAGGEIYAPYDFPKMPYYENDVLYLECGQGADGDYNGGDAYQLARYVSDDHGYTFRFDQMVKGK